MRSIFFAILCVSFFASCGDVAKRGAEGTASLIQVSPPGANAAEPAIAADAKGNLYVLWVDHSDPKQANVFLRKFDGDSKPVGDPVKINPVGTEVKSWFGDPPSVAVGSEGAIYVGWNRAYADAKGNDLVVSVSHDAGKSFDAPVKINDDDAPASHGMHSMAIDSNGRLFFAWLDERNITQPERANPGHHETEPNSEVFFTSSDDGGKTFAPNKRLASEVCPCCRTTLLAAANGQIYAAWRQVLPGDFRHVAVAHSNDRGQTFSEGVIVSDDKWHITACPVSGAALALDPDDGVAIAWYTAGDAGQAGLYTARTTDGGMSFKSRVLLSGNAGPGTPTIVNAASGSVITFAAKEGSTQVESLVGNSARSRSLPQALNSSAITSGDREFVCYVRKENDRNSVWLTRLAD